MPFPANPTTGQIYTTASGLKFIYSSAGGWKANAGAAGSSGPAAPISSATAPANPALGQLWYDTSADTLYLRVNDGTSDVWFDISSVGAATATTWTTATRPSAPTAGQTGFNTTTGKVEYWNGTAWTSVATGSGTMMNFRSGTFLGRYSINTGATQALASLTSARDAFVLVCTYNGEESVTSMQLTLRPSAAGNTFTDIINPSGTRQLTLSSPGPDGELVIVCTKTDDNYWLLEGWNMRGASDAGVTKVFSRVMVERPTHLTLNVASGAGATTPPRACRVDVYAP